MGATLTQTWCGPFQPLNEGTQLRSNDWEENITSVNLRNHIDNGSVLYGFIGVRILFFFKKYININRININLDLKDLMFEC